MMTNNLQDSFTLAEQTACGQTDTVGKIQQDHIISDLHSARIERSKRTGPWDYVVFARSKKYTR